MDPVNLASCDHAIDFVQDDFAPFFLVKRVPSCSATLPSKSSKSLVSPRAPSVSVSFTGAQPLASTGRKEFSAPEGNDKALLPGPWWIEGSNMIKYTRNKKLLVTSASLLVTSALLVVTKSY